MSASTVEALLLELAIEPGATFTYSPPIATSSSGALYYAKLGSASSAEEFAAETRSLLAINAAAPRLAPRLVASGSTGPDAEQRPYMVSEYKDLARLTAEASLKLAERLAKELHAHKSERGFGFDVPTFCGTTRLANGWYRTWEECYSAMIGGLLDGLRSTSSNADLCDKGEQIRNRVIPALLRPLDIQPVLLHGDLWIGNTGVDKLTGDPIIYDPSSFFGHNEADLAIGRIFGGFSNTFFEIYHAHLPKSEPVDQYELRVDLYELFHYLNHALMFGGASYARSAMQKMDRLLKYTPNLPANGKATA